jgi:hypothetical protein
MAKQNVAVKAATEALVTGRPTAVMDRQGEDATDLLMSLEKAEAKKPRVAIKAVTLTSPGWKLTVVARMAPGKPVSTLVTQSNSETRTKTRGCRATHRTWEDALLVVDGHVATAVKNGWTPPAPPKTRSTKTVADAFTAIPKPPAGTAAKK